MKTLFASVSSYTTYPVLNEEWLRLFTQTIYPLFSEIKAKTIQALFSKAEAIAPEIKKGVKITVHHSKDTALKQVR